jgi:Ser/Thr protein kinase RdoA (MazF antagonist)
MTPNAIEQYKKRLNIDNSAEFVKIDHEDAMVATVYKISQKNKLNVILKICDRPNDYFSEIYFLKHFANKLSVPTVINSITPSKDINGAILMEYLSGCLLKINAITKELAFEIGESLALIHKNGTRGYGYLNKDLKLEYHPDIHFTEKFEEGIEECKHHLPKGLIQQCCRYYADHLSLLKIVDGPCIIHRDFRPGNIIIQNEKLCGIIDWSSARSSFAEDDFCSIEHGEWGDFNGCKNDFLEGYSSIRTIPDYHQLIPLLRLNRAIAVIGFTVKRGTWNTFNAKPYQFNRNFLDNFYFSKEPL